MKNNFCKDTTSKTRRLMNMLKSKTKFRILIMLIFIIAILINSFVNAETVTAEIGNVHPSNVASSTIDYTWYYAVENLSTTETKAVTIRAGGPCHIGNDNLPHKYVEILDTVPVDTTRVYIYRCATAHIGASDTPSEGSLVDCANPGSREIAMMGFVDLDASDLYNNNVATVTNWQSIGEFSMSLNLGGQNLWNTAGGYNIFLRVANTNRSTIVKNKWTQCPDSGTLIKRFTTNKSESQQGTNTSRNSFYWFSLGQEKPGQATSWRSYAFWDTSRTIATFRYAVVWSQTVGVTWYRLGYGYSANDEKNSAPRYPAGWARISYQKSEGTPVDFPAEKTFTYNNETFNAYTETTGYTVESGGSGKDAGSYTAVLKLKAGYIWSDGTSSQSRNRTWKINKRVIDSISWNNATPYEYTGSALGPTVSSIRVNQGNVPNETVSVDGYTGQETNTGGPYEITAVLKVTGGQAKIANYDYGNKNKLSGWYIKDSKPPKITVTRTPNIDGWTNQDVTFTITGRDNADGTTGTGISKYQWKKDSDAYSDTFDAGYNNAISVLTLTTTQDSVYKFKAFDATTFNGVDSTPNTVESDEYPVKIDKIAPTLTLTQDQTNWINGNVTVTLTAADTGGSGMSAIQFSEDNTNYLLSEINNKIVVNGIKNKAYGTLVDLTKVLLQLQHQ